MKPYGLKPYGLKPYGLKPYGLKPYGLKPYGLKPYGLKPYGLKGAPEDLGDQWSAEISDLITERSAVIRLGATVIAATEDRRVPSLGAPIGNNVPIRDVALGSRTNNVNVRVSIPNRLARELAGEPELAAPLKLDLAEQLAGDLDTLLLRTLRARRLAGSSLRRLRRLVRAVRNAPLRNPGWIIDRNTLDELTGLPTADGLTVGGAGARSLDSYGLLRRDGADGATLLGFPVITSRVPGIHFSADWDELWVGIDRHLVNVAVSEESAFAQDQTVIRATMSFGSILRSPAAFARSTFRKDW